MISIKSISGYITWIVLGTSLAVFWAIIQPIIDFRYLGYDEGWLMDRAYQLSNTGISSFSAMGDFLGFQRNVFTEMPLKPFLISYSYKIFSLGIWQTRLPSILMGLVIIIVSYIFCKKHFGNSCAHITLLLIIFLKLNFTGEISGVPLIDTSISARYDIDQMFWSFMSLFFFSLTFKEAKWHYYLLTGLSIGLAFLSHPYTLVLLVIFAIYLFQENKLITTHSGWLLTGFLSLSIPYVLWTLNNHDDYTLQLSLYKERGQLLSLSFYLNNFISEYKRFVFLLKEPIRILSVIHYLVIFVGIYSLYKYSKKAKHEAAKLVLLAMFVTITMFTFFEQVKVPIYYNILVPLILISASFGINELYRKTTYSVIKLLPLIYLGFVVNEGIGGIRQLQKESLAKEDQRAVNALLQENIPAESTVIALSHFTLPFLKNYHRIDYARLGYQFSFERAHHQIEKTVATIIQETGADYILIKEEWEGWANWFSRPYESEFKEQFNTFVKTKTKMVYFYQSNIYGRLEIYKIDSTLANNKY